MCHFWLNQPCTTYTLTANKPDLYKNHSGQADKEMHSVAKGAGIALKNVDRFSFLMR